jgi:hypothetical protein
MECFLFLCLSQSVTQAQFTIPIVRTKNCNSWDSGKERSEVGKIKSIVVNPSKPANESFGPLNSNSIGSPYVDPGKYDLRSNVTSRSNSTVAH